eukprot:3413124-Pleurochrysis_carterae.AAC.1
MAKAWKERPKQTLAGVCVHVCPRTLNTHARRLVCKGTKCDSDRANTRHPLVGVCLYISTLKCATLMPVHVPRALRN